MRSILHWLIFGLCIAVFIGAMGWITLRMLRMEEQRQATQADAQTQERVRLALWRMDSMVTTLLVRENARPPEHYQPFHAPSSLYKDNAPLPKGAALMASPLLGAPPEFVQVHFELRGDQCSSPQVPQAESTELANRWSADTGKPLANGVAKLAKVHAMIQANPTALQVLPGKPALQAPRRKESASSASRFSDLEQQQRVMVAQNAVPPQDRTASDLRPVWMGDELLLVRDSLLEGSMRKQGLWLDWPLLRGRLLDTVRDLLPGARLVPTVVRMEDASSLVTLPVKLLPGEPPPAYGERFPLGMLLAVAWAAFALAVVAVGIVLHRTIVLSERRAAFVSAVTHELRTPLTTFQLYCEMLADDMVPDPERRREYLNTLASESTRLGHLVENVLGWSRIERGRASAKVEQINVAALVSRMEPRLRQRADLADLELTVTLPALAQDITLHTDASAVEQIVFNLIDNACKYAAPDCAPRHLRLAVVEDERRIYLYVMDHGPGLTDGQRKRLFRPFEKSATDAAHSAPGVGLGLALSRRLARELGGDLEWEANEPRGSSFVLTLKRSAPPAVTSPPR
jgi:signal transduction histidine kinase